MSLTHSKLLTEVNLQGVVLHLQLCIHIFCADEWVILHLRICEMRNTLVASLSVGMVDWAAKLLNFAENYIAAP